jgi:hypothetical protein
MTEAAMALMRKQKKRQRDRLRRLAKGIRTRAQYLAAHKTSKERPWTALGISRATWYRQQRETGPRQVKLTKTELTLVSKEKIRADAGLCGRVSTPTPAGQTDTYVNGFLNAEESAWLTDAIPDAANDDLLPWDDYRWLDKDALRGTDGGLIYAIG